MDIRTTMLNNEAILSLSGRLDTVTAPELENKINEIMPSISGLILDFSKLEYLSSAGLRVLLNTQKAMTGRGALVIKHVNDMIMDVFDMTGFSSILTIED